MKKLWKYMYFGGLALIMAAMLSAAAVNFSGPVLKIAGAAAIAGSCSWLLAGAVMWFHADKAESRKKKFGRILD